MNVPQPLREGQILTGPLFNEPMRVETVRSNGPDTWIAGLVGAQSERYRKVTLTSQDLEKLVILDTAYGFDGDGRLLRLGLQAYALGIAYEFDPYFGLSISRVDPLSHQLEAVYDYLLKLSRVRFLLADESRDFLAVRALRTLGHDVVAPEDNLMEPWYKAVSPRSEVRLGRSFNPDEFAIALEQVVAGTAPEDYVDPAKFFARTCFTRALRDHAGMVLRRLAGRTENTAPVLTLITQFGGGKTHTLATLYHLARHHE